MGSHRGPTRGIGRAPGMANIAAVVMLALALAACSKASGRSTTSTAPNGSGGSTTLPGSGSGAWTSCTEVPLVMINTTLGLSVTDPQETVVRATSTCGYTQAGAPSALILQIVTDASSAEFASAVQGFKSHGEDPSPVAGLGDEAVSVTLTAGGVSTTAVMAREGASQVLVSAPSNLDQVVSLVSQMLPDL